MPGMIAFGRKWPFGSDDVWLPAFMMLPIHVVLIIVLIVSLSVLPLDVSSEMCNFAMTSYSIGFVVILVLCVSAEACTVLLSLRGSITRSELRTSVTLLVYLRLGSKNFDGLCTLEAWYHRYSFAPWRHKNKSLRFDPIQFEIILCHPVLGLCKLHHEVDMYNRMDIQCCPDVGSLTMVELFWLVLGGVWMSLNYYACPGLDVLKGILFGGIICCLVVLAILFSASWYFAAGSTPCVHLSDDCEDEKCVQISLDTLTSHCTEVTSLPDCPLSEFLASAAHKHSLMSASRLFSVILRDSDLLLTDIYAGVLLLLHKQKAYQASVLAQNGNEVYEFLSGEPITPTTRFLSLRLPEVQHNYRKTVHFMIYCIDDYCRRKKRDSKNCSSTIVCPFMSNKENTPCSGSRETRCYCWPFESPAAVQGEKMLSTKECIGCARCIAIPLFHSEIKARRRLSISLSVDHVFKAVVVTISADLSLQEILKGLGSDSELIPVEPFREDWHAHKDMLELALDVQRSLQEDQLLVRAFRLDPDKGTSGYNLVLVGHSLGAGVAAVLSVLMRSEYPNLHCYCYAPPGALLSATCAEETKAFITSVILGKDIFPRFGITQLESFQKDLITTIKKSTEPKWKIIFAGLRSSLFGYKSSATSTAGLPASVEVRPRQNHRQDGRHGGRCLRNGGSPMLFSMQSAMYPPGRVLHIVRSHPKANRLVCSKKQVIYQAVWAENADFDNIHVSSTMLSDHMPETIFHAMKKVMTRVSPSKPSRRPAKPSREVLIGSPDISHFTSEDYAEPTCLTSNVQYHYVTCPVPGGTVTYDTVDCGSLPRRKNGGDVVAERIVKAQSFPPAAHVPTSPCPVAYDLCGMAPLASPEGLSESSSMASCGSNSVIYQRVVSSGPAPGMDPILQSPSRSATSYDCCLSQEASEVLGNTTARSLSIDLLPTSLDTHLALDTATGSLERLEFLPNGVDARSNDTCLSSTTDSDDLHLEKVEAGLTLDSHEGVDENTSSVNQILDGDSSGV